MLTVILVKVFEEPVRKSILEETTSQSRELATSTGDPPTVIQVYRNTWKKKLFPY